MVRMRRTSKTPPPRGADVDVEHSPAASTTPLWTTPSRPTKAKLLDRIVVQFQRRHRQWLSKTNRVQRIRFYIGVSMVGLFLVIAWLVQTAPPGRNYFDPSYWRVSQNLSFNQLHDLRHNFPKNINTNNPDEMESIYHPGYLLADKERMKTVFNMTSFDNMTVPKFWDPANAFGNFAGGVREFLGNRGEYLITPTEASAIGSFYDEKETIFVAIASYRDPECISTMESIFERAKYPERLRVAIIDQRSEGDPSCRPPSESVCRKSPYDSLCQYRGRIDYMEYSARLMVGPIFARHLANRMYRGEYFAMQVDSHVRFAQDWDDDIIDQWKAAGNEMAVLSTYMSNLSWKNFDPDTHKSRSEKRSIMCNIGYEWTGSMRHIKFNKQQQQTPKFEDTPQLHPFWAAGFSFSRGHFVVAVPYDHYLPFVFQGEEILQTIRGFTFGYDFYAPMRNVAFHMYAMLDNKEEREKVPKFTDNQVFFGSEAKQEGYKRMIGISGTRDPPLPYFDLEEERYGLGRIRSREQFFATFGIDPVGMTVEEDLCVYVRGISDPKNSMHGQFTKSLRYDKMGIDYSRINYRHKSGNHSEHVVDPKELEELQARLKELLPEVNTTMNRTI